MKGIRVLVGIIVLAVLAAGAPGLASMKTPPPPGVVSEVVARSAGSTLIAYGTAEDLEKGDAERGLARLDRSDTRSRELAPAAGPGANRLAPAGSENYVQHLYYSGSGETAWAGSRMRTWYDFTHARVDWGDCGGWCITAYINGTTKTAWYGWNPYFSDAIQLTERWKFRGLGVSASVSAGGIGAGFSSAGDEVTFNSGWVDTAGWAWRLQNKYSGVRGKTHVTMWGVDDTATGSHRFGYQIVTATANGGITWQPPDY
jgi:hypothetical protein